MIKAIGAVLMSVLLVVFMSGCGQSDQPAKPAQPQKQSIPRRSRGSPSILRQSRGSRNILSRSTEGRGKEVKSGLLTAVKWPR